MSLSWSASALKLAARDRFIGWQPRQRKRNLNQLAANSCFLIMPWVQILNLASHVLALNMRGCLRIGFANSTIGSCCWETFIDSRYFEGTCYEASNMRRPIEQCFQAGKSQVGMDKYEHRSWSVSHRHMTYVFLALHFMLRMRLRFKKNAVADSFLCSQNTIVYSSQISERRGGD